MSVWYAYGCGHLAVSTLHEITPFPLSDTFHALWRFPLAKPPWWSADKGTFAGIALGLMAARFPFFHTFIAKGKALAEKLLTKIFSRLIPLFILGFVARMYKTDLLNQIAYQYTDFLLWLVTILAIYIVFLFIIGSGRAFIQSIKNIIPAASIAISSGCSLSTMPWTIEGTSKNLKDPDLAKAVIPATTNIQQIGDCIANTFLCFLIYYHFNGHVPPLSVWIPFTAIFVLARYATAAILGGAIFIMLPIYEHYLNFTPEMTAMILAFNVILDPLITCTNVVANSALCRIFEKLWHKILQTRAPIAE
jgi:Na+/H+-dicarboxylate symporter